MLAYKMKINTLTTQQKLDIIVDQLKDIYCDLRASWYTELLNAKIRWKKVFIWKYSTNKKLTIDEIRPILNKYASELAENYWINLAIIIKELCKKENNLSSVWEKRLFSFFEQKNGILTRDSVNAILKWNFSLLEKEVKQAEIRHEEAISQILSKKRLIAELNQRQENTRRNILQEKHTKKKGSDQEITKKSHNTLLFENVADNLLDDPDIIIETAQDLNNYYDHSSWIDNSKENLEEIFTLYCSRKLYLSRYWLTIKMIREIYELWENSRKNNIQFSNNQHAWKYIRDYLVSKWYEIDKYVNTEVIKIYYAWLWQKKSTYWL